MTASTKFGDDSNTETPDTDPLRVKLIPFLDRFGILTVIVLIGLVMWALQPDVFFTWRNITNIFKQTAANGMLSIGMFLVILTAGIDLSVGSVLALGMMTLAVANASGVPWPIVLVLSPLMGMLAGFVNGLGITKLRMPHPFIMTLGMLFMARGGANLISGGVPYSGLPDPVRFLGSARIYLGEIDGVKLNLPVVFLVTIAVYFVFWVLLEHTVFGRRIYAIGGNPQAEGGGVLNAGTLTLTRCQISASTAATHGGALANVSGWDASADKVLDATVLHEQRYWAHAYEDQHKRSTKKAKFINGVGRLVTAITLRLPRSAHHAPIAAG